MLLSTEQNSAMTAKLRTERSTGSATQNAQALWSAVTESLSVQAAQVTTTAPKSQMQTKYATAIPNRAKKLLPYFRQKAKPFAANVLHGMNRHASARNTTRETTALSATVLISATDTEHALLTKRLQRRLVNAKIISQARPVTNARKNTTSMMQAPCASKIATRHADRQASLSTLQATVTVTTQATKEYAHAILAG